MEPTVRAHVRTGKCPPPLSGPIINFYAGRALFYITTNTESPTTCTVVDLPATFRNQFTPVIFLRLGRIDGYDPEVRSFPICQHQQLVSPEHGKETSLNRPPRSTEEIDFPSVVEINVSARRIF